MGPYHLTNFRGVRPKSSNKITVFSEPVERIALPVAVFVIGCAANAPAPKPEPRAAQPVRARAPNGEAYDFQPYSRSPQAGPSPSLPCRGDLALESVAARLAERQLEGELPDAAEIAYALRAAGAPYVWPRVWALRGDGAEQLAVPRAEAWLRTLVFEGDARCALAGAKGGAQGEAWVAIAVDVLADLRPLPTSVPVGSYVELEAELLFDAQHVELLLLGPSGPPRRVPLSHEARTVRSRLRGDREGPWLIQLMADAGGGPRPVAEALLFAGRAPDTSYAARNAPGESAADDSDARRALFSMANLARQSEGARTLRPSLELDRVAEAHAQAMRRAARLAHDVGQGPPNHRVEDAGLSALAVGENIAHAMDARSAHRVLWWSPSHRKNLLTRHFDHLGVGFALDPDGSLWVAEVFAQLDSLQLAP